MTLYEYNYSLIIPHYNIPELLERLLNTVPHRDDLQIIVVDDCSPEACQEQLKLIQDKFPKVEYYSTGTNGGGGKARNVGLSHARGKYILFADADDYFNLNFSSILDKYITISYDITYFAASSVDSETYQNSGRGIGITTGVNKYVNNGNINELRYRYTNPWCKLISHRLILENQIRFQESPVYNDMYFSQQVDFYAKTFNADSSAIYCVTARENSVSSINSPDKEIEKVKVMTNFYSFYRSNGVDYSPRYLIAPTYFDLRRMGAKHHAKRSLKLWKEAGVKGREIITHLCVFRFTEILHKFRKMI